ncbi:MAG: methyltransferase family protein [Promethearchaeota archaeon]
MSTRQHLIAILALPFTVTIIIPILLLLLSEWSGHPWLFLYPLNPLTLILGTMSSAIGLVTLYKTNQAFARTGKGTLAPWAPTQRLVAVGLYCYVRNPMIISVLLILLGEAILFGATLLFLWFFIFWIMNHVWFIWWEEPDLERRFGDKYREYKANVPRWFPRPTPWRPQSTDSNI